MNLHIKGSLLLVLLTLTGCATNQVERDLDADDQSRLYVSATQSPESFDPEQSCKATSGMLAWTLFEFDKTTPIVTLPSGLSAAAFCLGVPKGARAVEIRAPVAGGNLFSTLYDVTVVSPSAMLLNSSFELVEDVQSPGLNFGEEGAQGPELKGVTLLTGDRAETRYVVIYVHPESLSEKVIVRSAADQIPVPHVPYGPVKVKFHP